MKTIDVAEASITSLQQAMSDGRTTAVALTQTYRDRIAAYDRAGPAINAIVSLNPNALDDAAALDEIRRQTGSRGPLHGIPVLIKDNYDVLGLPTSAGAKALASLMPRRDAFQVAKLRAAGAVILGKTTMHELASGITNVSSLTGFTLNPYDPRHVPGGSSGGSGAAVAASFAAAAMGSDTSGSLRIPSSVNSLVSLRTSSGLSSRGGVVPLSTTQDNAGPMARTVDDLAIMLDATVGADPDDPSSANAATYLPRSFRTAPNDAANALSGLRIGVVTSLFGTDAASEVVTSIVDAALRNMRHAGAVLVDVTLPDIDDWMARSRVTDHEFKFAFAAHLSGYADPPVTSLRDIIQRNLHHPQLDTVFRLRDRDEVCDEAAYARARQARVDLLALVGKTMTDAGVDVLAYPTLRILPVRIGEAQTGSNSQLSASTGLPAIAFPAGFTPEGMPVGMEFLGRAYTDAMLLRYAQCWEHINRTRRAPLLTMR